MQPVRVISGTAVPLDRSDVDTDQIIPASWLKRVERTGFGVGLFSAWRESDPSFPLNRPEFSGASVLVAGPNFGVGSSREHAVWALTDYGFKAVISPRFGDIFRTNATKTGLVPVVVPEEFATALMRKVEEDPTTVIMIDVAEGWVSVPGTGLETDFPLDEFTRYRLVEGLDDIGLSLRNVDKIAEYEARRPAWMPRVSQGV